MLSSPQLAPQEPPPPPRPSHHLQHDPFHPPPRSDPAFAAPQELAPPPLSGNALAELLGHGRQLVYMGGDALLQLHLNASKYTLWTIHAPAASAAAVAAAAAAAAAHELVERRGLPETLERAALEHGLLPPPRPPRQQLTQFVYTGSASCAAVSDDGCDTYLRFEASSGRYFRFQRRADADASALSRGRPGSYELRAQGVWPDLKGSQLVYLGHRRLWAWHPATASLRQYEYKAHRLVAAKEGDGSGGGGASGAWRRQLAALAEPSSSAGEALRPAGSWVLDDLRGELLAAVSSEIVASYSPVAAAGEGRGLRLWLVSDDDGSGAGGGGGGPTARALKTPSVVHAALRAAPPRQLVGLHSNLLLEVSLLSGQYFLHGLSPDASSLIVVGTGRIGGPLAEDGRVCAYESRYLCVRDLRCGWCHARASCVAAAMSEPEETCTPAESLETLSNAAAVLGGRPPWAAWAPSHALSYLGDGELVQMSPDGSYNLWAVDSTDAGSCAPLLPRASGQWPRQNVALASLGGGFVVEHHPESGAYRLLQRTEANATTAALRYREVTQSVLPPPSTGRTLTPFGSGRLLDLDRSTGSYRIWAPCVSCAMGGGDPLPGASLLYDSPGRNFSAFAGAGIAHVGADEVMAYSSDASSFWRLAPSAEALRAAETGLPAGGGGSGEAESFPPRRTPHALPALELSSRPPPRPLAEQIGDAGGTKDALAVGVGGGVVISVDAQSGRYMLQRCAPPEEALAAAPVEGAAARLRPPASQCEELACPPACGSLRDPPCQYAGRAQCVADPACGWCAATARCLPGDALAPCSGGTPCASAWEHAHAPASVVSAAAVVAAAAEPAGQLGPTDAAIAATDTAAMLGAARAAGCVPLCLGRVTAPERQLLHVGGGASSLLLDYRWATNEYRLLPFHPLAQYAPVANSTAAGVAAASVGGATPLKPLTPGTQCDVFEYSRGTRGVWNLFEPPYEPAVDRWSACARQRAPLLLSLGRAPSDGASELIAAVDRLSGRHEVFECESAALAAGTGPDEACSLIARGQLDDWRCTDALASLGRGRLLHHDTRTGEYVVLELVPPPPDTADAFEGLNATEAAEAEAEATAAAEAAAAAQAAAAGGAARARARQRARRGAR